MIIELLNKLKSIRASGINTENKTEALVYFKYIISFLKSTINNNYIYQLIDELIIYGYYFNMKKETFSIIDKLEIMDKKSFNIDQMLSNKKFYIPKLKVEKKYDIIPNCKNNFVPMNSSILKLENSYLMLCRTVNYKLYEYGKYDIMDENKIQRSESIMIELDKDFNIESQFRISDKSKYIKYDSNLIKGLEDGILFNINNNLYMSCTSLDTNIEGKAQITVCKFDNNYDIIEKEICKSPYNRAEKNWLPIILNNNLSFLYSYHPLTLINSDGIKVLPITHKLNLESFKGSAAPIQFGDNYLIIIHQSTHRIKDLYVPLYSHRFLLLDKDFNILKMSQQFYFENFGIEFCRSMCYSHEKDRVIITYSVNDSSCNCCVLDVDIINGMLIDINSFELTIKDFEFMGLIEYEDLLMIYEKVKSLRNYPNKTNEMYVDAIFYIKIFFELIDGDLYNFKMPKVVSQEIKKLIFLIIDEIIILGYYINYSNISLILSERLILSRDCNISKHQAILNQRFYIEKLKYDYNKKISPTNINLKEYNAMNPSIIKSDSGYIINCRMINYEIDNQGLYFIKNENRKIITENVIIITDKKFKIISEYLIVDKSNKIKLSNPNIHGYEDLILFNHNNKLKFSCTTLDTNIYGRPQISICTLNDRYEIIEILSLESPQNRMEKNWLPIIIDNEIDFIYEYNPFTINSLKGIKLTKKYELDFSRFKGSAAPILFDDGYLIIVHETFNLSNTLRCYLHRFIYMNKSFEIIKISHPFYFEHHGIEFCRSMCHSHNDESIILTYSIRDKDSQLCEIKKDYINSLLKEIDFYTL